MSLRTTIGTVTVAAFLLTTTAPALRALPSALVCPPGHALVEGTAAADRLRGSRDNDCLVGNDGDDRLIGSRGEDVLAGGAGDDRLAGGGGNDMLEPGPGKDIVSAGPGDDLIVIRAVCELESGERISGGPGSDTLRSPVGRDELKALGVRVRSIETVEVAPSSHDGACIDTPEGPVCSCCNDPNGDPATGCTACQPGFFQRNLLDGAGDLEDSTIPAPACVAITTCADIDCGANGTCVDNDNGGTCACAPGYAGTRCEACAPLFDAIAPGTCALGATCSRERCGGHGLCVLADASIRCVCDDGWDLDANCGGDSVVIGGPHNLIAGMGAQTYGVALTNGAHCSTDFTWSLSRGSGTLTPDPTGSRQVTYTPPSSTDGRVEHVAIEATCDNDASVGASLDVTVAGGPAAGEPGLPVTGACDPKVAAAFDEAMLSYMEDNALAGGTLAITYQEEVVCLRGYGLREFSVTIGGPFSLPEFNIELMQPCTPIRVASVTKPFTRAAFRGNLFGQAIPVALGGGTVGESTPILPILANTIGLGPNGEVPLQMPVGFYGPGYPALIPGTGVACNAGDGLIHPSWGLMTLNNVLAHRAGFNPNQNRAFAPTTGGCLGTAGEICGLLGGPGDPTISSVTRMANDLGIVAYGEPTVDDAVQWLAGICPFDTPAANRFRYSNAGFTVLGKVIEDLTGQSYENYLVGFLENDGIVDVNAPGSPVVYLGQSKGGGPRTYELPEYMQESEYFSPRADATDVTDPVFDAALGQWTFPFVRKASYGSRSYDVMAAHGGLVMNALALAKFGSTYQVRDGSPRDSARGGPGLTAYDDNPLNFHGGRLAGVAAMTWELETAEPPITNINGIGCLVRDDVADAESTTGNALNILDVEPCVLPPGIRVSVLFNTDLIAGGDPTFVRGRHDQALLGHMVRLAAAKVGATAAEWDSVLPLKESEYRVDCDYKCPPAGPCVDHECGNGELEGLEQCDDGNNNGGDGCNPDCTIPAVEPGGYDDCDGAAPGACLGGPCAARQMQAVDDSERLDWFSHAHPDGDYSRTTFCHDSYTQGEPWEEATCVRTQVNGKTFGVCRECGVDTMTGCVCPAPNSEDGGCNMGGNFAGYSCTGGRCWQGLPPNWMCTANCADDIYGNSGFCHHDDAKGAVCYQNFCDEPMLTYCADTLGAVCDANVNGCANDSCCTPECLNDADCTSLGYEPGHMCLQERCKLAP